MPGITEEKLLNHLFIHDISNHILGFIYVEKFQIDELIKYTTKYKKIREKEIELMKSHLFLFIINNTFNHNYIYKNYDNLKTYTISIKKSGYDYDINNSVITGSIKDKLFQSYYIALHDCLQYIW